MEVHANMVQLLHVSSIRCVCSGINFSHVDTPEMERIAFYERTVRTMCRLQSTARAHGVDGARALRRVVQAHKCKRSTSPHRPRALACVHNHHKHECVMQMCPVQVQCAASCTHGEHQHS
jgi:hypothetical protein